MRDIVLYVGNFFYPTGNAAGKRVYGNLEAIAEAGYRTACFCFRKEEHDGKLQRSTHNRTTLFTIPYTVGRNRLNNKKPLECFKYVLKELGTDSVKQVIMYNSLGTTEFNEKVIKICHKKGIKVAYDIVDYFDEPDKNNILRYFMKKRELNRLVNKVIPACDCWITISTFLKNMMPDESKTMVIPPLACESLYKTRESDQPITFVYATFLVDKNRPVEEWKDRLDTVIDVFCRIRSIAPDKNFRIKFIGFTEQNLLDMFPVELKDKYSSKLQFLRNYIIYLPQMPNEEVQKEIMCSDFMILLRDSKTCNNAGFPTKVSEAVSIGVPALTNLTSDIGYYLQDKENSIIVENPDQIEKIVKKVLEVLSYSDDELNELRRRTFETRPFYYKDYAERFKEYLGD